MGRVALIDADELAYKAAFNCQSRIYLVKDGDKVLWKCKYKQDAIESIENNDFDIDVEIIPLGIQKGIDTINKTISRILYHTGSDETALYLSGPNNFRGSFATILPYKGHRPDKPIFLEEMKEHLRYLGALSVSWLEADDLLANASTRLDNCVICTQDKDLKTVPCNLYNPRTKQEVKITEEEALHNFYYQLLIGDNIDNIPSPYGLGDKAAKKILSDLYGKSEKEYFDKCKEEYQKYLDQGKTKWYTGQPIEDILYEVGNLLYMRRTLDKDERWGRDLLGERG